MAEFSIVPNQKDVELFFGKHPELRQELHLITLMRMHSDLLDSLKDRGKPLEPEEKEDG